MEAVNSPSHPFRPALIAGGLALFGWAWSISDVGIPDVLWLVTVALTLVFLVALAIGAVRHARA